MMIVFFHEYNFYTIQALIFVLQYSCIEIKYTKFKQTDNIKKIKINNDLINNLIINVP